MKFRETHKIGLSCCCAMFLLLIVCIPSSVTGAEISATLEFPQPEITYKNGDCIVQIENLPVFADPGEPLLPIYTYRVLIPQGEQVVSVTALAYEENEIEIDFPVHWEQYPLPLGYKGPIQSVSRSVTVYESHVPFPAARASHVTTQTCRGYTIAYIRIYPVTYVAGADVLVFAARIGETPGDSGVFCDGSISHLAPLPRPSYDTLLPLMGCHRCESSR